MNRIAEIAAVPKVQAVLASFAARLDEFVNAIIAIQQIPAPTHAEAVRAAYIETQFQALGLADVQQDDLFNVYGRIPGTNPSAIPPVIVTAHSDTVFPAQTDLTVTRKGKRVYGPGIGDNATGVAGLIFLAEAISTAKLLPQADIWFVSNVCEEGLGDLRGMRAVVDRFGAQARYIVVEGGMYSQLSHQAIGVCRFRVDVATPGGHSWGDFGQPSAIHEIAHLITQLTRLSVPAAPKTTFNIGVVEGGTSINTIAQTAHFLLDLRSESAPELEDLVKRATAVIETDQERLHATGRDVTIKMTQVGNRPAGTLPATDPLVRLAHAALKFVGVQRVRTIISSTDANIPLSKGITAVCVGLTISGNAHRLDEFIDPTYLPKGLQQLLLLTLGAADYQWHN